MITDNEEQESPPGRRQYVVGEQSDEMKRQHDEARERQRLREVAATASSSGIAGGTPGGIDAELTIYNTVVMKNGYPQIAEIFYETHGHHTYPMIVQAQAGI
eukprot:7458756-Heterocapsa_arctica.AAC.1